MGLVMGIDPGINGAAAVYSKEDKKLVSVEDLPRFSMMIGKAKTPRKRLDPVGLLQLFERAKLFGVEGVVIEWSGTKPFKSTAGLIYSYSLGLIFMACVANGLVIETLHPRSWKRPMGVMGKKDSRDNDAEIMAVADGLFPLDTAKFRGARGGPRVDRAEAALMACYAAEFRVLENVGVLGADFEWRAMYQRAQRGL